MWPDSPNPHTCKKAKRIRDTVPLKKYPGVLETPPRGSSVVDLWSQEFWDTPMVIHQYLVRTIGCIRQLVKATVKAKGVRRRTLFGGQVYWAKLR